MSAVDTGVARVACIMQVIRLHDAILLASAMRRPLIGPMLGRLYPGQDCALARALELIGERWTLLIVRDARFRGSTRFRDFQSSLGIASNILARRLDHLVESGVMTFDPATGAYGLSESGRDLLTVAIAATEWGEKWVAPGPIDFVHGEARAPVATALVDAVTGERVDPAQVAVQRRH